MAEITNAHQSMLSRQLDEHAVNFERGSLKGSDKSEQTNMLVDVAKVEIGRTYNRVDVLNVVRETERASGINIARESANFNRTSERTPS